MAARINFMATQGDLQGQEFVFTGQTRCVVGRSTDCSLRLPASDVLASRHHCLLAIDGPRVQVLDLGSLNGTYVNGQRIGWPKRDAAPEAAAPEECPNRCLAAGDELRVGRQVFRVSVEGDLDPDELHAAECGASPEPANEMNCAACC